VVFLAKRARRGEVLTLTTRLARPALQPQQPRGSASRPVGTPRPQSGLLTDGAAQQVSSSLWALLSRKAPTPSRTSLTSAFIGPAVPRIKSPGGCRPRLWMAGASGMRNREKTPAACQGGCSAKSTGEVWWGVRGSEPPAEPAPRGLWSLPQGQVGTRKEKQAHSFLAKDANWRSGGEEMKIKLAIPETNITLCVNSAQKIK